MEENKKSNKNGLLIIVIIILLLIIGFLVLLLIKPDLIKLNNKKETKVEEKQTKEKSIKIDNNKDLVYDADYKYDNKFTEYNRGYEDAPDTIYNFGIEIVYKHGTEYLKDLVVPYININTDYATKVNYEIKEFYLEKAKTFDECAEEVGTGVSCTQTLSYKVYQSDDILSVVTIYSIQGTAHPIFEFKVYNFDLKTGDKLTFENYLKKVGLTKEEYISKAKETVHKKMDELWNSGRNNIYTDLTNCNTDFYGNVDNCYNHADNIIDYNIQEGKTIFLINEDKKASIITIPYYSGIETADRQYYLLPIE